jgi:hypothetical protein
MFLPHIEDFLHQDRLFFNNFGQGLNCLAYNKQLIKQNVWSHDFVINSHETGIVLLICSPFSVLDTQSII